MSKNNRPLDDDLDGYGGDDYALYQITPCLSAKRVFIKVKKEYKNKREEIEALLKPQREDGFGIMDYFTPEMEYIHEPNDLDPAFDYISLTSINDDPSTPEGEEQIKVTEGGYCIYGSYYKIHDAIQAIAPYAEDCRFFICSLNDHSEQWVDEYNITNGTLSYTQDEWEEYIDEDYFKKRLGKKKDEELKKFIAFLLTAQAEDAITSYKEDKEADDLEAEMADFVKQTKKLDPSNKDPLYYQGLLYKEEDNYVKAHAYLDKCVGTKKETEAKLAKAIIYIKQEKYTEAITYLKQLKDIKPHHKKKLIQVLLAHSYLQTADRTTGIAHLTQYTQLVCKWVYSEKTADEFYAEVFYTRQYHTVLNEWISYLQNEGVALLQSEENKKHVAYELLDWGEFFQKKYTIKEQSPEERESLFALANRCYDVAYSYETTHTSFILYKKGTLIESIDAQKAFEYYQAALQKNPDNISAIQELAYCFFRNKDYDSAIAYANRVMDYYAAKGYGSDESMKNLLRSIYEEQGDALIQEHQYKEAEPYFRKAQQVRPTASIDNSYEARLISYAEFYTSQKKYEKSLLYATAAVKVNDQSVYSWAAKGDSLTNLERYEEALACYETAFALKPDYYYTYYRKACTLTLMGHNRTAIYELIKKALELNPKFKNTLPKVSCFKSLYDDPEFLKLVE